MDLTPEQIEDWKQYPDTACRILELETKAFRKLCDMALQTAAAHARITQLEQALREALGWIASDVGFSVEEIIAMDARGMKWNGRFVAMLQAARQALEHTASGSNERPAEESAPRGNGCAQ